MLSPWCLGGCLRERSAKIPWEMVPGRRVPVLWSVPRSGGSLEGEKEQSGEEQRCSTHSQATLTEDSEEALGMQEGYLGHSSGHTGTLAPRHKNCMYSRGRLHRGRKDATYHKTAAPGDPEAIGPSNPTLSPIPTSPLPQYTVLEGERELGRLVTSMPPAATHSWGVVKASLTCEPLRANWGRLGWGSLPTPILFLEQEHSANVRSLLIQIRLPHTSLRGTNRADSQVKQ